MEAYMKISVIVPYHNAEKWIRRCCESLHNNKGEFEFIMVDDHSTDDSAKIVKEYADIDDRFFMYENIHAKGVSGARNTGLDLATGDWICFLDADDEYAPGTINAINASVRMYPEADLIQLNHARITANGIQMPRMFNPRGKYPLNNLPKLWMSSCNKLFRANLIEDIRFKEGLDHGEDEIFVLECLKRKRCIYNSEHIALLYHKDNPNSLSSKTTVQDLLGEQRALCEFAGKHKDDPELLRAVRQRQSELWNNACYKRVFGGT